MELKKFLAWTLIAVLLFLVALPVAADSSDDTDVVVFDETVFFQEPSIYCSCVCSDGLNISHMAINNVDFFSGTRMDDGVDCSCFACGPGMPFVVFLNGVQNLVKDLFKEWEMGTIDVYIPDTVTEIDEDCFVKDSNITIHFTENNEVALAYARAHNMRYEIMGQGYFGKAVFRPSIFFEEPQMVCDCLCSIDMGVEHLSKDGLTFFRWCGDKGKMPAEVGGCFQNGPGSKTVVFLDGVPNLSKDLFKAWEDGTNDVYIPDSVTEIDESCFVDGSQITLHFTRNNEVALAYAKNHGMAFEVMNGGRLSGDVNYDKSTDMKDVLTLRKIIAHLPMAYEIYSIDMNNDGSIDMKDVLGVRWEVLYWENIYAQMEEDY